MKAKNQTKRIISIITVAVAVIFSSPTNSTAQNNTGSKPALEPVGTHSIVGTVDGIDVEAMVQSPSANVTPLQVICVFEYTEGDIFNSPPALPAAANGLVHVDKQLRGLLTEIRKGGKFKGRRLETMLVYPPKGTLSCKMLLIVGLGDRKDFTPDLMTEVGSVAMHEALRLGVTNYGFASDLKDGGIDSPTGLVAQNEIQGAFDAYSTELYLEKNNLAPKAKLKKIIMLAGQPFYDIAGKAMGDFIKSNYNN